MGKWPMFKIGLIAVITVVAYCQISICIKFRAAELPLWKAFIPYYNHYVSEKMNMAEAVELTLITSSFASFTCLSGAALILQSLSVNSSLSFVIGGVIGVMLAPFGHWLYKKDEKGAPERNA